VKARPQPQPILVCVSTRPEVIKMAPVIGELTRRGERVQLLSAGEHGELLRQALATFALEPDVELELTQPAQSLAELTARALPAFDRALDELRPQLVLVQGDTTTAFCGALAAFYRRVPVGHVEAGLRTSVPGDPFPEEANRALIGRLASWHFCATALNAENLLREAVARASVHVTGNTIIDAAFAIANRTPRVAPRADGRRGVLVTLHCRQRDGECERAIGHAIAQLAWRADVHVIFPLDPSPSVRESVVPALAGHPNVTLCEPLDYETLIAQLCSVELVLTDSGGLQEEASAFDLPVLIMRETTERPEGVAAGCSILCGAEPERILAHAHELLDDRSLYARMASARSPYGDGHAAERIVDALAASSEHDRAAIVHEHAVV
jgi:UDP-N-acetylglucosamine 2-epimerase (non-hydrolysing)